MPGSSQSKFTDSILVAMQPDAALVRVQGRASFKCSPALKTFCGAAIERGIPRIIMDMETCVGMDSTFMGVLAGIAVNLKAASGGVIQMINLSGRTRGLLATLGLDQMVEAWQPGESPAELADRFRQEGMERLSDEGRDRREMAKTMLEAHETLVEVFPENRPKFKDVLDYLREDMKKTAGGPSRGNHRSP
ncbi:MAG: STAS domain-containing protein [Kiritimatiellia bacterium]